MANSTAGTILTYAWNILRTSGTSTDVPALQESFMLTLLSQANMEWLTAHRRGGGAGPLAFLRETGFDLIADTDLNMASGLATSDTSFAVDADAAYEASNGALVLWDDQMPDVVTYTAYTSATKTFSGISGIAFNHEDEDAVQALYKLPANFRTFRPSDAYGDGVQLNGVPLRFKEGVPGLGFFSLYDDGTNQYLWLPRGSTGTASVFYEKQSATIDSTDDTVDVPPSHEFFLVWRIVEIASVPQQGGEVTQLYATAKLEAAKQLNDALKDRNVGQYIRPRPFRPMRPLYSDPSLFQRVPR